MKIINITIENDNTIGNELVNVEDSNPISFLGDAKTDMVYVTQMVKSINEHYRSIRNRKRNIRLDDVMRKQSFTESAIALESELTGNPVPGISRIATRDSSNRITNIAEICPTVIQTKKGGKYQGTWLHKRLIIVILSSIDGFIANKVQKILIEQDIFGIRNKVTSAHKLLGDAIHTSTVFETNQHVYNNVNKLIKKKLEYKDINDLPVETLEARKQLTEEIATLTKYGILKNYWDVKAIVEPRTDLEGESI